MFRMFRFNLRITMSKFLTHAVDEDLTAVDGKMEKIGIITFVGRKN